MNNEKIFQQYFDRLGIAPARYGKNGQLDLVRDMHKKHIAELSFSSIGVLLGKELPLDVPALMKKMVEQGDGGYCFEHNKLFSEVLSSLNYNVRSVLARVLYNKNVENPTCPKTHRLILLEMEGETYVVDVGFGYSGPKQPVRLSMTPTEGPMGDKYRVMQNENRDYLLQTLRGGEFFTLYSFDLNRYNDWDFEMAHFFSHKHPTAGFVNNLVVARVLDKEVRSLRNGTYQRISPGCIEETEITNYKELQRILSNEFNHQLCAADCLLLFGKFCV